MIFDEQSLFSDDQAITADAASTNYIDFGAPGIPHGAVAALSVDQGKGRKIPLAVTITEAFDNLTSLDISFQVDDNAAFSSPKTVWKENILLADLVAGKQLNHDCILKGANERYGRMYYDVNGTNPSTGKVHAGVVMAVQEND